MRIEARAPAKLVLLGEYAVLHGAPAIVAAVDRLVHVAFEPAGAGAPWTVTSDLDGGCEATLAFDGAAGWTRAIEMAIEHVAAEAGASVADLPGGHLRIESRALHGADGEAKLGLGSSAAVVVALAAVLREARARAGGAPTGADPLAADLALHRAAQGGRGSGVDVAASHRGGVLRFQLVDGAPQARPLALPPGVELGVVWTGTAASTTAFVEGVRAFAAADPAAHDAAMARLGALARDGVAACEAGDAGAFLATVDAYREGMDALGRGAGLPIVSAAHAALAAMAAEEGVAYKPSGAGGGDVGLLFAPTQAALVQAGRKAEAAGYRLVPLDVHPTGVEVTCHERSAP